MSNTRNENEFRYQWMLGFVHGYETTMYPDRKDSRRGGRITYGGPKEINREITKQAFINAIEKACKDNPGYPLSDSLAEVIMRNLNITPSQSDLPREPYMLEISVCEGRIEAFVGTGEFVSKGAQMISVECPNLILPHREVVWVIFGQISSGCLLLLLPLWACGQRTCVVHHVHSDVGRAAYSIRGSVTSPCPALGPTGASRTRMQRPRTATRPEACR